MRSLVVILYSLILGSLFFASATIEWLGSEYYEQEVSKNYLHYGHILTKLIEKELSQDQATNRQVHDQWLKTLDGELNALTIVAHPGDFPEDHYGIVEHINISEQTDTIVVIIPFTQKNLADKALKLSFNSAYSDSYMNYYYLSTIAVYAVLALVIATISWSTYRYMKKISQVSYAVARGDFSKRMPNYRLSALNTLANNINTMSTTIEEKTSENLILTGAIHHELRIPITRLRLALDIALNGGSEAEIRQLLLGMDSDLEELSQLTEEILAISRLRLRSIALASEPLNMKLFIDEMVRTINNPMIKIEHLAEMTLTTNKVLFERALLNILDNAIKYAQQQVIITTIKTTTSYQLKISDDGPGIPEDERQQVLKPFYRTDKSRNRHTGGFGLGLAIADMVIKDTGGTLEITDSKFAGAEIVVTWDLS
ncbi:MAG: ATP-binding protein [Colwellia sp.]|nr:ATP-binding protein [Colwellia sp.]